MTRISENIKRSKLKAELAQRIEGGEFPFGARFPGINDLIGEYNASYVTVNKALKLLADEGYLRCRPGVGYFVCYVGADESARKEVNLISSPGHIRQHQRDFDFAQELFRQHGWKLNLLAGGDLYEFTEQLNSPHAYSIITAFNVNWERFSATFGHMVKRTVVLGRLSGNPEITSIVCDEYETIRQCMDHFLATGRKKTALVCALPQSELESIRIAAWRGRVLSSGLSLDWARQHLLSLDLEKQPDTHERRTALYRSWLRENLKDTDSIILPDSGSVFSSVCREMDIKIPEQLSVIGIGLENQSNDGMSFLDNNYRGHFLHALDILEDRFNSDRLMPGSWFFCSPRGIISSK